MEKITPFKIACFISLMDDHGDGFENIAPSYAVEKVEMLSEDEVTCFSRLDQQNMAFVLYWMHKWHEPLPIAVEQYMAKNDIKYCYSGELYDFTKAKR